MKELILINQVVNTSVSEGFLPATRNLGLRVVLLRDSAELRAVLIYKSICYGMHGVAFRALKPHLLSFKQLLNAEPE